MALQSYKQLHVWQKSMDLVADIYQLTSSFPKEELYGLTSQIRRSAVSLPSNIAEGAERNSTKDYIRFLSIAYGSLAELETQLMIAFRIGYLDNLTLEKAQAHINEIARMLNGLSNALSAKHQESLTTNH